MKKLANLKGVKTLNRMEQKSINGGAGVCIDECYGGGPCGSGESCHHVYCQGDPTRPDPIYGLCVGDGENQ